jgi:hypothetical protein
MSLSLFGKKGNEEVSPEEEARRKVREQKREAHKKAQEEENKYRRQRRADHAKQTSFSSRRLVLTNTEFEWRGLYEHV